MVAELIGAVLHAAHHHIIPVAVVSLGCQGECVFDSRDKASLLHGH